MPRVRLSRRQLLAAPALTALAPLGTVARQATPEAMPIADGPQLQVSPLALRSDEAFDIVVTKLEPGTEVTIRSSFLDFRSRTWTAEATWVASDFGYVACSGWPPIRGDFDIADSMAFIWAATAGAYTELGYLGVLHGPNPLTITASIGDEQIRAATIEQTVLPQGTFHDEIRNEDLVADYFAPAPGSPLPAPGMIVVGGSEGGISPGVHFTAARLAARGYAALAVGYFGLDPLPRDMVNIPLEYFGNAIARLHSHPDVENERIGMLGFSRGAEATLLVASHYPEIKVAISYSGSGVTMPSPTFNPIVPAYTWMGEPIPYADEPSEAAFRHATIAVENINGAVMLVSGDDDVLWGWAATTHLSRIAWDRLQLHDHPWPDQLLTYPGAGHGIQPPYQPMTFQRDNPNLPFGGSPHADQIASVNSWRAALNTLDWRLGGRPAS